MFFPRKSRPKTQKIYRNQFNLTRKGVEISYFRRSSGIYKIDNIIQIANKRLVSSMSDGLGHHGNKHITTMTNCIFGVALVYTIKLL